MELLPWESEPNFFAFVESGLPCYMIRHEMGSWCGYVGVPKGHPLFGKETSHESLWDLNVHGGVTWADGGSPGLWWLGFDCAHSGDLVPGLPLFNEFYPIGDDAPVYRDFIYVGNQCRGLAKQLAHIAKPKPLPEPKGFA